MDELKPCPFCGGEAKITNEHTWGNKSMGYYSAAFVVCDECGALVEGRGSSKEEARQNAITAWNRRVETGSESPIMTNYERLITDDEHQIEIIGEALCSWANTGNSYIYDLTRVKTAFGLGTMHFEDFKEWDEDRCFEIAAEFVKWLNSPNEPPINEL